MAYLNHANNTDEQENVQNRPLANYYSARNYEEPFTGPSIMESIDSAQESDVQDAVREMPSTA